MSSIRLLVVSPFGGHAAGDRITDKAAMDAALRDHPTSVLREPYDPPPAPAPAPAKAPEAAPQPAPAAPATPAAPPPADKPAA